MPKVRLTGLQKCSKILTFVVSPEALANLPLLQDAQGGLCPLATDAIGLPSSQPSTQGKEQANRHREQKKILFGWTLLAGTMLISKMMRRSSRSCASSTTSSCWGSKPLSGLYYQMWGKMPFSPNKQGWSTCSRCDINFFNADRRYKTSFVLYFKIVDRRCRTFFVLRQFERKNRFFSWPLALHIFFTFETDTF